MQIKMKNGIFYRKEREEREGKNKNSLRPLRAWRLIFLKRRFYKADNFFIRTVPTPIP